MGTQMTIPFTLMENGAVQTETDIDKQTSQRVRAIVGTEPGQRAMRADMGIPLSRMLFGVGESLVDTELRQLVTDQMGKFEPGTVVTAINPVTSEANDGVASLDIEFAPLLQASPARVVADAAVIRVGGTVKEVSVNG